MRPAPSSRNRKGGLTCRRSQGTIAGSGSRGSRRHSSASYGDARRKKLGTKVTRAIAPHVFTNDVQIIPQIKERCLPSRIARLRGASLIQRRRELSGHNDSIAGWHRRFRWDESFPPLHRNAWLLPAEPAMYAAAFRPGAALSRAAHAEVRCSTASHNDL